MRLAAAALFAGVIVAVLTPLQAAAAGRADRQTLMQRTLAAPQGGDDFLFRNTFQHGAQDLSNRLFGALQKVLGGAAPELNFVPGIAADTETHLSATPAANRINIDPYATQGLIDEDSRVHSGAVNQMPHEMMHLRQTAAVLASLADREGGAQAFADVVSPEAAALAHTKYDSSRNYDGAYSGYVKQAQARGRDWIFGGQMGKTPVAWP